MGKKAIRPEMVTIAQRIGFQIREARIGKGLKQKDVAQRARIPASKLSKIENGRNKTIDVSTLFRIARAMDVSCDELCNIPIEE